MLLIILIALLCFIALILVVATTKPDTVHYERSITINASAERILPHIHDFHKWMAWSPYEKFDPGMKREFSGATEGKGAKYAWDGNGKAGAGTMEVLETSTAGVKIDLRFTQPFKNECIANFVFTSQGAATKITWSLDGPSMFMGKVMSVFMNMDKMIGKDFEAGLADLKSIMEK